MMANRVAVEQKIDLLVRKIDSLMGRVDGLKGEVGGLKSKLAELDGKVTIRFGDHAAPLKSAPVVISTTWGDG